MGIKKVIVACSIAVTINMISSMPVMCIAADSKDPVSAAQGGSTIYVGMPKKDLFEIYQFGNIQKYEKKDNKEVFV